MFNSLLEELVFAILKAHGCVSDDNFAKFEQTLRLKRALVCPHEGSLLIEVLVELIDVETALIGPIFVLFGLGGLHGLFPGSLFLLLILIQAIFETELDLALLLGATQCNQNNASDDGKGEAKSKIG